MKTIETDTENPVFLIKLFYFGQLLNLICITIYYIKFVHKLQEPFLKVFKF